MNDARTLSTARPFQAEVGSCIYCRNANTTNLTREHVIPHSLGGGIILGNASCNFHSKMTRHFEGEVAGDTLKAFRLVKDLPSYNRKSRPKKLPVLIRDRAGERNDEVPISQYPDILPIPSFDELPGFFSGIPAGPPKTSIRVYHSKDEILRRARLAPPGEMSVSGKVHIASYIRLTAKIAHGYAITHFGFEFDPFLLNIIEGDISKAGHVIGATHKQFNKTSKPNMHIVGHETFELDKVHLILVSVGLFAGLGAPVHTIIAGCYDSDKVPPPPPWLSKPA